MNLPLPKLSVTPRTLFPVETLESLEQPITSAAARNVIGDFYEEATANITGAHRLRTSSNHHVCPDLRYRHHRYPDKGKRSRIFFESKAVGNTRHVIIYENRWSKDHQWLRKHKAKLYYCIWSNCHTLGTTPTISGIHKALAHHTLSLFIIPTTGSTSLATLLPALPLRVLNTAYIQSGPNAGRRLGYGCKSSSVGVGWSVPLKQIAQLCHREFYSFPLVVYNHYIPQPVIRTCLPVSQLSDNLEFYR